VSFRLSSLNFCRAGIAGFVCLALVSASFAGEGAKNIEVVPLHGTAMDTNFDQSTPADSDSQAFKPWTSLAPRTPQAAAPKVILPPPSSQNAVNIQRAKELLDRRRNWVFMSPEDYASDGKKDDADGTDNAFERKPGTAMERYYQRLYDADHPAGTNQFGKLNVERSSGQTNLLGGDLGNAGNRGFGDGPFSATPNSDVFQSVKASGFADVFGADNRTALPSPEEVRAQAEQKAHMESFKQLWNIDQPAPIPVATPPAAPIDSGPLFGLSAPTMQVATPADTFSKNNSSSQPAVPEANINTMRANSRPPRADFSIPQQRPF